MTSALLLFGRDIGLIDDTAGPISSVAAERGNPGSVARGTIAIGSQPVKPAGNPMNIV
jgi:hypothetical protein